MKLLEKKTINESVAKERKSVIDSGLFLAKKVDVLRQDLLDLEKQRADFIAGSRESIDKAIGDQKKELSTLEYEVKQAKKELLKLREPLDEEWKQLENEKDKLEVLKNQADVFFKGLIKERRQFNQEREETIRLRLDLEKNKELSDDLLEETIQNHTESVELRKEAQALKDGKEAELYIKELSLEAREKKVKEEQETLVKERLELNKEKKLLSIKKQRIGQIYANVRKVE